MIAWVPAEFLEALTPPAGVALEPWEGSAELPASWEEVEVVVPPYLDLGHTLEVLPRLPRLRVVQLLTAGYDTVAGRVPEGVTLCNARGVHDASTAELAVALVLASLRGFPAFVRAQDSGIWAHAFRESLADRRVLVVGVGSVGQAIVDRLRPFETQVRVVGRTARPGVHGQDELPGLLPSCDVVILVVPLDAGTRGLVDAAFLARMPDGALLVNVARGPVVDTDALVGELSSGRLHAALDVTDPEPLPAGHPLWSAPNCLVSPHVGGNTTAFHPRAATLVAAQLGRLAAGRPPVNVVGGD